jgi:hypothetical protein
VVVVTNRSDAVLRSHPPHPMHLSYRWLRLDGAVAVADGKRTILLPELEPGATVTYAVTAQAPAAAGRFVLQVALVQENVRWLDEPTRQESRATVEILPAD